MDAPDTLDSDSFSHDGSDRIRRILALPWAEPGLPRTSLKTEKFMVDRSLSGSPTMSGPGSGFGRTVQPGRL